METIAASIHEQIGAPLGLDAIAAAAAVLAVTTNQLAHAIRLVSVEKGRDPRDAAAVASRPSGAPICSWMAAPIVCRSPWVGLGSTAAVLGSEQDRQPYPSKPTTRHFKSTIS